MKMTMINARRAVPSATTVFKDCNLAGGKHARLSQTSQCAEHVRAFLAGGFAHAADVSPRNEQNVRIHKWTQAGEGNNAAQRKQNPIRERPRVMEDIMDQGRRVEL
jgi:hypothetical protein